jgi:hypothetical protein
MSSQPVLVIQVRLYEQLLLSSLHFVIFGALWGDAWQTLIDDGELLLVLLLLRHHLLSLDLGDVLVDHLLGKLRLIWIAWASNGNTLCA